MRLRASTTGCLEHIPPLSNRLTFLSRSLSYTFLHKLTFKLLGFAEFHVPRVSGSSHFVLRGDRGAFCVCRCCTWNFVWCRLYDPASLGTVLLPSNILHFRRLCIAMHHSFHSYFLSPCHRTAFLSLSSKTRTLFVQAHYLRSQLSVMLDYVSLKNRVRCQTPALLLQSRY